MLILVNVHDSKMFCLHIFTENNDSQQYLIYQESFERKFCGLFHCSVLFRITVFVSTRQLDAD